MAILDGMLSAIRMLEGSEWLTHPPGRDSFKPEGDLCSVPQIWS